MALQLGALRTAMLEADEAAQEAAGYETRLSSIETRLSVLTWMVATSITLIVIVLGSTIAIWTKLGEISGRLQ